jgi:hypothetical protein
MSEYRWVACGEARLRIELFGEVEEDSNIEESEVPATYRLLSVAGIRARHRGESNENWDEGEITRIDIEEIRLDEPILLRLDPNAPNEFPVIETIPGDGLILEGIESPDGRFLDLVFISGWKLVLDNLDNGTMRVGWYLLGDWAFDTHPDYFPGTALGEVSFVGTFGGASQILPLKLEMPWPFSTAGHLSLQAPTREGDEWEAGIDVGEITSIFDGAGPALRDFALGNLDLSSLAGAFSDRVFMKSGLDTNGDIFFRITISLDTDITIAEFGGQKLTLTGGAECVLKGTLGSTDLALDARLDLKPKSGFRLDGPLTTKVTDVVGAAREIVSLISTPGAPEIPQIRLDFTAEGNPEFWLGKAQLPLRWDSTPLIETVSNAFEGLRLANIDGTNLEGYSFGSIEGDFPQVRLQIEKADFEPSNSLKLAVRLGIQAAADENPFSLKGTWRLAFDFETLSFIPGRTIELDAASKEFRATGLHVTGLNSLAVTWEKGQLSLAASDLKAFFGGITDPSDYSPGFELDVSHLKIGAGGLDLDLAVAGGVTKVAGIGEAFKGAKGGITIVGSRLQSGFITAEGPLPWLDNATGSITLMFKEGLRLDQVKSEFQLGIHRRTDWWLELDLKSVRIDIDFSTGRALLLLMVTGAIEFKPPPEGGGDAIASYLKSAKLEFKDLLLTKAFDSLPSNISLLVDLAKPAGVKLLEAFELEMRGIGIGPGTEPGQAAVAIGGQIFFSSKDLLDVKVDFHKLKLQKPSPGSLVPRVSLEGLGVRFKVGSALQLEGFVSFFDTPERKGFMGSGKLVIAETIGIGMLMEFSRVRRASDGQMLRVWMVYAEWLNANIPLISGIFLRDIGMGFGWRKTLAVMEDPALILADPSKSSRTVGPHLPTSWIDDLEGADPHWTVVLSAWLTFKLAPRNEVTPLVGDILLGLRSDLTFILAARCWALAALDRVRTSERSARPMAAGLVYYSPRHGHLLASFVSDPSAAVPEGIPPALVKALTGPPYNLTLEVRSGLFRLELGWPRQLGMQLGLWRGRAGFLCRVTGGALTIGVGFEIGLYFDYAFALDLGIARIAVAAYGNIGVYGQIIARIGTNAALYGTVGVNAAIRIAVGLYVNFKIGFIRIKFSIEFGFELALSARLGFGISSSGFGFEGYAAVSLRIWKFALSAEVAIALNKGVLEDARRKVSEGLSLAGNGPSPAGKIRTLPDEVGEVPSVGELNRRWTTLHIQRRTQNSATVYMLLLPEEDTWFATPTGAVPVDENTPIDEGNFRWADASIPDYEFVFNLKDAALVEHLGNTAGAANSTGRLEVDFNCPWNQTIRTPTPGEEARLGDWFYESQVVQSELRQIDAILADPRYQPELLTDWRVRAEKDAQADDAASSGLRPDVRSPYFASDGDLYDLALEEARGENPGDTLSWPRIALGMTGWAEQVSDEFLTEVDLNRDDDNFKERLFAAAERLNGNRSTLVARLLHEFRNWALNEDSNPLIDLLTHSGLAFKFETTSPDSDWQISVDSLKVNRGNGVIDTIESSQIEQATVQEGDGGLGFARTGYRYRVRDFLEFQDPDGIHFSWQLECIDPSNEVHTMTPEEMSGLVTKGSCFEYFDHYEVERINLSSQDDGEGRIARFEVQPAFIPSLLDLGAGQKKFFLVVPRFELSDQFQTPAAIGDLLLYRIMAVDVFGNRSQTTEYLTSRKQLNPPPPPDSGRAAYEVKLTSTGVEKEELTLSVQPASEMVTWSGSPVSYEIWANSLPIASGGYYGLGNDADEQNREGDDQPVINPRGMTLIRTLTAITEAVLTSDDLSALGYGQVHEFYVRAVSREGNASRLVRCSHGTRVSRAGQTEDVPDRTQGYLERIPPPSPEVSTWMSAEDMRFEIQRAREPRPNVDGDGKIAIEHRDVDDPTQREVTLRLLHRHHVDSEFQHPTGGYEVLVRDRDATALNTTQDYRRLAEIEVVTLERYRHTPNTSEPWQRWHGRYLRQEESPAVGRDAEGREIDMGYLDWGEAFDHVSGARIEGFPEGRHIHWQLEATLFALQKEAQERELTLAIHGGPPPPEELSELSFTKLLEDHAEEKDPYGSGLLKRMGRSVDLSLTPDSTPVSTPDLFDMLSEIVSENVEDYEHYRVVLEVLVNGDRRSQMGYYRLSLQPRLHPLPPYPVISAELSPEQREEKEKEWQQVDGERQARRMEAFNGFKGALEKARISSAGILDPGAQESYEGLTRRFLRQRPLSDPKTVAFGVAFYEDSGSFRRPLNPDETIAVQLYYKEPYARRYAYRVQRVSRYLPLYRELGLWSAEMVTEAGDSDTLLVRLPRVKPPAPPVASFLGNFDRGGIPCSEWLLEAPDEEAMVQSNETLRNRLGYRGVAWSLFAEAIPSWELWSGWRGETTWAIRSATPDDGGVPGFSETEKSLMTADASWPEPTPALPPEAGLAGHPFTGLLTPKGTVVRMPKLPYYYRYRLGAFARTDDVDSVVKLVDASQVFPSRTPTIDLNTAGWRINPDGKLEIWWRIPSAWESLDETESAIWANENPYASRLWDFDLKYTLQIRRQGVLMPLVYVRPVPPEPNQEIPANGYFTVQTAATYLYHNPEKEGKVEFLEPIPIPSPFRPELSLTLNISETLKRWMGVEDDFVFEVLCFRSYGEGEPTLARVSRAEQGEVTL